MRKFKVIKKWPGGPEVGEFLSGEAGLKYVTNAVQTMEFRVDELEGFVEEVNWPEEFWCLDRAGKVMPSILDPVFMIVPNWLRFPTKEHAQAFADFMKDSLGVNGHFHGELNRNLWNALNSRSHAV